MRLLLHHVPNPTSFDDLRTYENKLYDTFQETCSARGLLDSDEQWDKTIKEAIYYYSPKIVRNIFHLYLHTLIQAIHWNYGMKIKKICIMILFMI